MSEGLILISPPVQASGRQIYPIVRASQMNHPAGGWISATPIALFIEEEGSWYFVALDDEIEAIETIEYFACS